MLGAVAALHRRRLIHNDLKPANFVLVDGGMKLIDFGITSELGENEDETSNEVNIFDSYVCLLQRHTDMFKNSMAQDITWLRSVFLALSIPRPSGMRKPKSGSLRFVEVLSLSNELQARH